MTGQVRIIHSELMYKGEPSRRNCRHSAVPRVSEPGSCFHPCACRDGYREGASNPKGKRGFSSHLLKPHLWAVFSFCLIFFLNLILLRLVLL